MKAIIVIYVPPRKEQTEKDFLDDNIIKCREKHPNTDFLYIEDPARERAEVEVFFNPYDV